MYKKYTMLTVGLAAAALVLAVCSAEAAGNQAGGANATPSEMPSICKPQAAPLKRAGTAADDFVKKCTGAPANAAERKSAPKLQGMK